EALGILRRVRVPDLEVGFGQLEDAETTVLPAAAFEVELAGLLLIQLADHPADALLADVGDGLEAGLASRALRIHRLGKLHENELAVAAILLVQFQYRMCRGAGTGE